MTGDPAGDQVLPDGSGSAGPAVAPRSGGRHRNRDGGWRHRRRRLAVAGTVVAVVVGLLAYGAAWFDGAVHQGPAGRAEIVTIPSGASVGGIAHVLATKGIIGSELAFHAYLFLKGTPTIGPGGYLLHRDEPFGALLTRLTAGPDVFPVTVQVGTTEGELAQQVASEVPGWTAASFVRAVAGVGSPYAPAGTTTLDGLLGLGTYLVLPGEQPATLAQQMVDRFDATAQQLGLSAAAATDGVTPYQAVTVASIVEKEGYYPENFGGVARVIYNRLHAGMRLQMDSTVLYALHQDGGTVTPADLQVQTPYNTYLHGGLTPTPICFPSVGALQAALHPPAGAWLYFELVRKDGTMAFEDTLAQHQADIALAHQRGLP